MFFIFNFNFFFYDLFFVDTNILSTYTDKIWLTYSNLISLFLIIMFIILLGIVLANNAKHVKFLNLTSAFYLTIFFFYNSLNYPYEFLNLNWSFNQNTSLFVNLFILISTITAILFFLGISNVFFIEENSKIEFSFLVWFIYLSAVYLISSTDFISIIILLECIAFSSYVLVGFERKNKFSTTSALKYLILASIPSGFFILGIALLYNNFGTFSQDYLSILFNSTVNFEFKFDQFTFSQAKGDLIQQEIFLEFLCYVQYLNDIFELWTPHMVVVLKELFVEKAEFKNMDVNNFSSMTSSLQNLDVPKDVLNQSISELCALADKAKLNDIDCKLSRLLTFYPHVIHELRFLKIIWENLSLFYEEFSVETKNNNNLYIFLRENNLKNILTWFQFFAKEEFLYLFDLGNSAEIFIAEKSVSDALGFSGIYTYNDHNNFSTVNELIKNIRVSTFVDLSLEALKCLDLFHSKIILLANKYVYNTFNLDNIMRQNIIINENFISINIDDTIFQNFPFVKSLPLLHIFISDINSFYKQYVNFSSQNMFELTDFFESSAEAFFIKNCENSFSFYENLKPNGYLTYLQESIYYTNSSLYIYLTLIFILVNLCFKLTAAPFHVWAPSVYGGSPLATLTFLSIFSKLTIIFFTIWLFLNTLDSLKNIWQPVILIISFLSVICSILGAFSEKIFKRFFVYSSIGHVGFMLIGIAVLNLDGIKGTIDYLILYIISSFLIWFILLHLSKKTTMLVNLKGLSFNQPMLSLIFSITIFSLSGIPPFGGFFVKYEIFYSMINSSLFYFAYILLLLTVVSFFYYLRLIKIIFFEQNKTFVKNKNIDDIKLRIVALCFFIIPFFMLFIENPLAYFLKEILYKSLI